MPRSFFDREQSKQCDSKESESDCAGEAQAGRLRSLEILVISAWHAHIWNGATWVFRKSGSRSLSSDLSSTIEKVQWYLD
jgi:hypothetical protein